MKLVSLIEMCLNETYSTIGVGKNLTEKILIKNVLKQGDILSSLFFNLALEYAIRRVPVNKDSFKLNGTHQLLVNADLNILGRSEYTRKKNTDTLVVLVRRLYQK